MKQVGVRIQKSLSSSLEYAQQSFNKFAVSKASKLDLFRNAINKQTRVTLDNITGKGVDIPLLGIRKAMTALLEKGEIQRDDYKTFEVSSVAFGT